MTNEINRRLGDDDEDDLWDDAPEDTPENTPGDSPEDTPEDIPEVVPRKSKKGSFFDIGKDEENDDFFNNDTEPEPEIKPKPKPVKLDPEDPDYWIEEESDISRMMPKPGKVWKWWFVGILAILLLLIGVWIWFFRPYVDGAVKYGYIKSMEQRGTVVKTFEGVLIPYRELGDSTPTYFEEIRFSVEGDSLAAHMKGMMLECVPVMLEYKMYHTPLFWKGSAPMVITHADTADVRKILPPEYR
ncbi:MAG: hypothetical protein NC095_03005 [Muribaculum sp.]|nr:hypothetical protein [Muribaculum sp.]